MNKDNKSHTSALESAAAAEDRPPLFLSLME